MDNRVPGSSSLDEAFKALASAQRREILRFLGEASRSDADKECCGPAEVCACKLGEHLGLAASTISHHMNVLRRAGLVHGRKEGLWTYYTLDRDALQQVASELSGL